MSTKFNKVATRYHYFFSDVIRGDSFVIDTIKSAGTVYMKVVDVHGQEFQLEYETGRIFPPTTQPVKIVDVSITLGK